MMNMKLLAVVTPLLSLDIVFKYNDQRVLSLIITEGKRIIKPRIIYLSKYIYHFTTVSIKCVACTHIMSMLFGSSNEINSQTPPESQT